MLDDLQFWRIRKSKELGYCEIRFIFKLNMNVDVKLDYLYCTYVTEKVFAINKNYEIVRLKIFDIFILKFKKNRTKSFYILYFGNFHQRKFFSSSERSAISFYLWDVILKDV